MTIENGKYVIHAIHERDVEKFWKKLKLKDVEHYEGKMKWISVKVKNVQ